MPSGTAMTVATTVISIVPTIAGPIPPTPTGAVLGGMLLVRKDQLIAEAPLAITVNRTNASGMSTTTNDVTIRVVTMRFLVRRQPFGSRRSGCPSAVTAVIRHHASAG